MKTNKSLLTQLLWIFLCVAYHISGPYETISWIGPLIFDGPHTPGDSLYLLNGIILILFLLLWMWLLLMVWISATLGVEKSPVELMSYIGIK